MRHLCDNPACSSHCEIQKRNGPDGWPVWKFADGFGCQLTKEQLQHFSEDSRLNLCVRCRGCYGYMLERMRASAPRRRVKPKMSRWQAVIHWLRSFRFFSE